MEPRAHAAAVDGSLDEVFVVYSEHLRQIILLCRDHDAVPVLATYPFVEPDLDAVRKQVATGEGAAHLDIAQAFEGIWESDERSQYFVKDGHCNDKGYGLMARTVTDDLIRRVAREQELKSTRQRATRNR